MLLVGFVRSKLTLVCIAVTSAHCNPAFPIGEMVFIGANLPDGSDSEFDSTVAEVVAHPDFIEATFENDIALVRLAQATTITPAVWNAALAVPADGDAVTVIGFGNTNPDGVDFVPPEDLQKVSVNVVDSGTCANGYPGLVPAVMVCAAALGVGPCQGDS